MSVRFGRFGAPAVAGVAIGGGLHVWVVSAAVAGVLVAAVSLVHAQPGLIGGLRRLLRRR